MTNKYKIREICGDWGLDIPRPDLTGVLIFNSRSNAELVKAILEWEDANPNKAVPFNPTHAGYPLTLDRLQELVKADLDGRCVVLPPDDYTWTIRGDVIRDLIQCNCRAAEKNLKGENHG